MALTTELENLKSQVNNSQSQQAFYGNRIQNNSSQGNGSFANNRGNGDHYRTPSGTQPIATWRKTKNIGKKVFKDRK